MLKIKPETIFITGCAASGKKSLARKIKERYPDYQIYLTDDKSEEDLIHDIREKPGPKIIVGALYDSSFMGIKNPWFDAFKKLLKLNMIGHVIIIKPASVQEIIKSIITRFYELLGTCEETPDSITNLIMKYVSHYEEYVNFYGRLTNVIRDKTYEFEPYDHLMFKYDFA